MTTIQRTFDETDEVQVRALAKELGFQDAPENETPIEEVLGAIDTFTFERFDKAVFNVALPVELAKAQPTIDAAKQAFATAEAAAQIKVEATKPK